MLCISVLIISEDSDICDPLDVKMMHGDTKNGKNIIKVSC